jgi:hypothetical protein
MKILSMLQITVSTALRKAEETALLAHQKQKLKVYIDFLFALRGDKNSPLKPPHKVIYFFIKYCLFFLLTTTNA